MATTLSATGATNVVNGILEVLKKTTHDEIKHNVCVMVKNVFDDIQKEPEFTNTIKTQLNNSISGIIDKIIEESTKELAKKYNKEDADVVNHDISDTPTGGSVGGTRKHRSGRKTKGGKKSKRHPATLRRKYKKPNTTCKHKNKKTAHNFSAAIMTSVKRECTCTGPKGCTCVESRESISDPPEIKTLVGGNGLCEGVV
jgi:hypothetical protein